MLRHLPTFASVLLVAAVSQTTIIPRVNADSTNSSSQLVRVKDNHPAIAEGSFVTVDQDHPTEGQATILEEEGKRYLVFSDNFTTARGPAVRVVLHQDSDVGVNLTEGSYTTVANLQSFDGGQKYLLPEDLDVSAYNSVAIWCEQFNVTFGYAAF